MYYVIMFQVEVPENVSWECARAEPWRVAATWALDLPQYNEWMNEEDYEVDAAGKKKVCLRVSVFVCVRACVHVRACLVDCDKINIKYFNCIIKS